MDIKFKSLVGAIYKVFLLIFWTALCMGSLALPIWLGVWIAQTTGNPWYCIISFIGVLLFPIIIGVYAKGFSKILDWLDRGLENEEFDRSL